MNENIKKLILGLVILLIVGLSLLFIFKDSDEQINYFNNKFVTDHITGEVYHGDYSQYDYLKYEFFAENIEDYGIDIIIFNGRTIVLENLNMVEGSKDNQFYFDIYLGDEFKEGEYDLFVRFKDLSSGQDFEILDEFVVEDSNLLMSEPVATTISEGVMVDYRRIPIYSQSELINVYYKVFNMAVVGGEINLGTGIALFDYGGNFILADSGLTYDNVMGSSEMEKYFELDTSVLETGVYSLDVIATDYNSGLKNMKRMVFAVI